MRRRTQVIGGAVLALMVFLGTTALYALKPEWFPRLDDLPRFDEQKAKTLSPQRRAELEHELFAELRWWNTGTRRYSGLAGIEAREARWREMASEGFELADIVLRVLDPSSGTIYSLRGPMRRLERLAETGDVGAMCLMVGLVNQAASVHDWKEYRPTYRRWLLQGVKEGHPECLDQLGARMLLGVGGHEKNIQAGLFNLRRAVLAGYIHGAEILAFYYAKIDPWRIDNIRRSFCWFQIADSVYTGSRDRGGDGSVTLMRRLEVRAASASNEQREQLQGLMKELRVTTFTKEDCVRLGVEEDL